MFRDSRYQFVSSVFLFFSSCYCRSMSIYLFFCADFRALLSVLFRSCLLIWQTFNKIRRAKNQERRKSIIISISCQSIRFIRWKSIDLRSITCPVSTSVSCVPHEYQNIKNQSLLIYIYFFSSSVLFKSKNSSHDSAVFEYNVHFQHDKFIVHGHVARGAPLKIINKITKNNNFLSFIWDRSN